MDFIVVALTESFGLKDLHKLRPGSTTCLAS